MRKNRRCTFTADDGRPCPIETAVEHYEGRWARAFPSHTPKMREAR